jgi:hypothetical protein
MKRRFYSWLLVVTLGAPQLADAGVLSGFAEGSVGIAAPIDDDGYQNQFDSALKYGVRAGGLIRIGATTMPDGEYSFSLGVDAGGDFTRMDFQDAGSGGPILESQGIAIDRWRWTVGPRLVLSAPRVMLFARAGIGQDRMEVDFTGLLAAFCEDTHVTGRAIDGSFGLGVPLGRFVVGAQAGFGKADHSDSRPPCTSFFGDKGYLDGLDNDNTDLDLQLMAAVRF